MNLSQSIVGTWSLPSSIVEDELEFMHVGGDGRIVQFVHIDSSGEHSVPMILWSEPLEQDRYRIRVRPGDEGWIVRMIPTETGMTIAHAEREFHLRPVAESELPDWYAERLQKALIRMSERESEGDEAQEGEQETSSPSHD